MGDKDKTLQTYGTDKIFVSGAQLKTALYERTMKLETLFAELMQQIAVKLRDATGEGDPFEKAALLLVVLEEGRGLGAHAMEVKAFIERAAQVQRDRTELSTFGRTIMPQAVYELSWEDAERYGV